MAKVHKYWEDFVVGEEFTTPGRTVGEGMINVIAGLGGYTLPFFWDEQAAKETVFGTRVAPGRVTLLMMGGLEEQGGFYDEETLVAVVGLDKVRISSPLKHGDTLKVHGKLLEKREAKNPKHGIIVHQSTCVNQRGQVVATTESTHLIKKRPA